MVLEENLKKIKTLVDCARITFLRFNRLKQSIASKKAHDPQCSYTKTIKINSLEEEL